jgi:uncharacterized protein (DUF1810 family)
MASLDRFTHAQANPSAGIAVALSELRAGRKTSHWIWYVFPQLAGLGHSATARHYELRDLEEARAYLRDPQLRANYLLAAEAIAAQLEPGASLERLMGGKIDALKLVSSLTLFELASAGDFPNLAALCREILARAEAQGFPRCSHTRACCAASHD